MKIKFCGAAQEVTGSAHLITLDDGYNILLDCGLYQGHGAHMQEFNRKWLFNPADIDCLIVSHAHIDHTGRIPMLVRDGFKGDIISTPATRSLGAIMLLDSAGIQEREAEYFNKNKAKHGHEERDPLYTEEDVAETMKLYITVHYERWKTIRPGVEVLFRDAGHILGSASVTLRITRADGSVTMLGFTGDIGRPHRPILADPAPMPDCDYLICESTYGDREHESEPDQTEHLVRVLHDTCVERRGRVIIPAFSVGRTQEIVYMLDKLATDGRLPRVPVYIDSPLSVNATEVFTEHPECFDEEMNRYLRRDPNPFGFNGLRYIRKVEESKQLNELAEPCIIISSSGMANAGRVKHHLFNNIENPDCTVLIVGYCSPDTPGGYLRAGEPMLRLFGEWKKVRARVEVMDSFSAHGDRKEMLGMIKNHRKTAKKVFLVHGDLERQTKWKAFLQENGFGAVEIPSLGDSFEL